MGAKIFLSHTFHVRNKYLRTHPKPSPAFRMVRLRVILIVSYVFFTLSIFIILLTLSLYRRDRERSFVPSCPSFIRRPWRTPPCPKSGNTRWVLGGSRQKGYRRVAGVSARRSDAAAIRKARGITSKTHLLSHGAPSRCTWNNSE